MSLQTKRFYEFADFRLDLSEKVLLHDGHAVPLTPKVFDTLEILIENAGHLLEKDELMQKIWQDRFVEESNLTFNVKMLRKALGDDAAKPRFIETVPRRGYRFIAAVEEISDRNGYEEIVVEPASLTKEDNVIANNSLKSKRFLLPIVALAILLIGTIAIGSWYMQSNDLGANAPILAAPFKSQKLSTNGKVVHAVISQDGRNVVYTNGIEGKQSIWLRQLESGNNVEIIPPSDDVYAGIALSPDGNYLYFVRRARGVDEKSALYRVSIFGGVPSKIVGEMDGWISISSNGGKVSFVRCYYREDENCSLWIADASDGKNERKLASRLKPFRIGDNEFAPDGKSVAFATGQSENLANEFSLMEVDIESGVERELTPQRFFNIKNLAWLPDKSGLLLTASKILDRNFKIWQVSSASGEALPLTKDSETYSGLNLDREGRVLVSTQVKRDFRLHHFQAEDPVANKDLADAGSVAFAPNGKIIFSSLMSGNEEIWSVNSDGSEQRQLTNNPTDDFVPVVSPDNSSVFFASNRSGAIHVWRMSSDGSNQTQLTKNEGGFPLFVSPDGEWLFYHHALHRTLWRVSINSDQEQLVLNKAKSRFALSPDGSLVAFEEKHGKENVIVIMPIIGGHPIYKLKQADPKANIIEIAFLPNGNALAYILADSDDQNNTLWLQSLDKGNPREIANLGDDYINHFAIAPDGKTYAIAQGGWKHDAVLISGLK